MEEQLCVYTILLDTLSEGLKKAIREGGGV
jgi:hypothetical protein